MFFIYLIIKYLYVLLNCIIHLCLIKLDMIQGSSTTTVSLSSCGSEVDLNGATNSSPWKTRARRSGQVLLIICIYSNYKMCFNRDIMIGVLNGGFKATADGVKYTDCEFKLIWF